MRQKRVHGCSCWRPVAFIASEKRFLERVLRDKAVPITPEGRALLNALPGTFREFKAAEFIFSVVTPVEVGVRHG
jgi:hypothetical protein